MTSYGSVWTRMIPGGLFQGFPGPNPVKNINKLSLVPAIPTLVKHCMGLGLEGFPGNTGPELAGI